MVEVEETGRDHPLKTTTATTRRSPARALPATGSFPSSRALFWAALVLILFPCVVHVVGFIGFIGFPSWACTHAVRHRLSEP